MPGSASHIAIADRIYSVLGNEIIKDLPLFFGGSIAPDAIHAKQGYTRADKRHTHLTEGIPTDTFHNPEKRYRPGRAGAVRQGIGRYRLWR